MWVLVEKPEGRGPLGRPRNRWLDNIKMCLTEIGLAGVGWIHLVSYRVRWWAVMNMVMNLWLPYNAGHFLTS